MKIETTRKPMVLFATISLSDIVLLLLIYFMLTSTYVMQPGIKVKLPKAASGAPEDEDKIFLTITKTEQIFINDKQVSLNDLGARLRPMLQDYPEKTVVIRADKDLTLDMAIRVVDKAKLAGAERFMIATEQEL